MQCSYVILLIYGWIRWNSKKEENPDFVQENMSPDHGKKKPACVSCRKLPLWLPFQNFTDASLPWLDSTLTTASLIAQWMVAKRKLKTGLSGLS
ncbi:MAG: nicotinamide mononucleotide transporter [Bacteroidetes bacterium]|nr:nicotinamide mononucleotide transporter [Bacteroidota bacterium]